jgi:predicted RNA binding protein YcfA (HicA-like mRNA interferase family)
MKVPRDINANELITLLSHYGYTVTRQTGSHIRLSKQSDKGMHNITIPNHSPIKVGTLHSIIKDFCNKNDLNTNDIYKQL